MTISIVDGGGPPVVLVSPLGDGGEVWRPVVDHLAGIAVVTHDRPGTGRNPPRPEPNPALPYSVFADELAVALDSAGVDEPVVVVGHSVGASIGRLFAGRHPRRVAAMVHIDGSIPAFHLHRGEGPVFDGEGPGATEIDVVAGHVELLQAPIPRVPTVVLVRRRRWWVPSWDVIPHPAIDELWQIHQRKLAAERDAPLIVADAGHLIPQERPGLVAYVVGAVHRAVATSSSLMLDPQVVADVGGRIED